MARDQDKVRRARREWYARNREREVAKQQERNRLLRESNVALLRRIREESPCSDCGISYPYYVMDFDHVRGEKKGDLCGMARAPFPLSTILAELDKCEVVCANCHRKRTHNRMMA